MRKSSIALLFLTGICLTAVGDEVTVGRLKYSPVTIIELKDGKLVYEMDNGRRQSKHLYQITGLQVAGCVNFDVAEQLVIKGKKDSAIGYYDKAIAAKHKPFVPVLASYRKLILLEELGRIDESVATWLKIMDADGPSRSALKATPKKFAPQGDRRNIEAIKLLRDKQKSIRNKKYLQTVTGLLQELYKIEGDVEAILRAEEEARKAQEARKKADKPKSDAKTGSTSEVKSQPKPEPAKVEVDIELEDDEPQAPQPQVRSESSADEVVAPTAVQTRLLAAETLVKQKKYAQAEELLKGLLDSAEEDLLHKVLLARGRAQAGLADSATGDQQYQLRLQAGLNLMRVVAHYPDSNEALEALYEAAGVLERLPNRNAAVKAYRTLAQRCGDKPIGKKATEALKRLGE